MKIVELRKNRSEVVLNLKGWFVRMTIQGPGSARERRQLGLAISNVVSKTLTLFETHSWIVHPAGYWANIDRDSNRGIYLNRAPRLQTRAGRLGFEIRTKRLKLGCSQVALSTRAGINASHLSLIEWGFCKVQELTLSKLDEAFKSLALERERALKAVAERLPSGPKRPKKGASEAPELLCARRRMPMSPAIRRRASTAIRDPFRSCGCIQIIPTRFGARMIDLPNGTEAAERTAVERLAALFGGGLALGATLGGGQLGLKLFEIGVELIDRGLLGLDRVGNRLEQRS